MFFTAGFGLSPGQQDTELSEKGRRQAQLAGHRLMYERFTHAFASDLKRAYEVNTLEIKYLRSFCGYAECQPRETTRFPGAD